MRNKKNLNLFSLSDYFSNYQFEYFEYFVQCAQASIDASIDTRVHNYRNYRWINTGTADCCET